MKSYLYLINSIMVRKIIAIVVFLAAIISCSTPEHNSGIYHLDIKTWPTKTIDLENVIKEIRIVPLETNPECLMSYVGQMQFDGDTIVALDGETNQILCFDRQGKFLRKFGTRGKGPGEYTTAAGILFNQEKSEILLNRSPAPRVNFFNPGGQFLRSVSQDFSGYRMRFIGKDLVAVHAGRFGFNKTNCELAVLDLNGKISKTYFPFKVPVQGDGCFGFAEGTKPGSALYHRRFDYNIYELFADRIDTLLTVDFGSAAIDTGAFLNTETADKLNEESGKIFGFASLANTPDHLLANIYRNDGFRGVWVLDHQSKNQLNLAMDSLASMGNFRGVPIHFPRHTNGSWFIADYEGIGWFEMIKTLSEDQKAILRKEVPGFMEAEKVTADGNPVLVYYRLKNF
jgi:hypothetical protein